jgi:protein-L-isoaspartate(D-aspartate) O-methyltransferase
MMTTLDPPATRAPRHAMVASQLRPNAVTDERIVAAMASIPREHFLPADVRAIAYIDRSIPVGRGREVNPPLATARLLTEAELEPTDRVLLVGAGGGYAAAVLAEMVAHVTAVETDEALLAIARDALADTAKVELVEGPLPQGWAAGAPYDVLIVDGAVEELPPALIEQVQVGGRVVTGLAERGVTRLAAGRKTTGGFGLAAFADAECVRLPGFARPVGFRF